MKLPHRRQFLYLAAGAAVLPAMPRFACAQSYPTRPARIIVPFPAGQATDTIARLMGQSLLERLGQPFVIENRTGAGGNIGTESVVRAAPDGYTLLLVGLANAINVTLYKKLHFNFIGDFRYTRRSNLSRDRMKAQTPRRPPGFIEPCLPTLADAVPIGSQWAYEIKHDGFRFMPTRQQREGRSLNG